MSVLAMYREFRNRFPELTEATDARHIKLWGGIEEETANSWFESLAAAVNDQMRTPNQITETASVFQYFERRIQGADSEVTQCIDARFVENLFWEVTAQAAAPVWAVMPPKLQGLYLAFHERPPGQN